MAEENGNEEQTALAPVSGNHDPEIVTANSSNLSSVEPAGETSLPFQDKKTAQQLLDALTEISAELSSLNLTVESRLSYDKIKEEAFDRLYAELEDLKRNSAFEHIRPLYIDLILFFDRVESIRHDTSQLTSMSPTLAPLLRTLSDELLEILYRREVEIINVTSSTFNPTIQRAIGTQPVSDETENNYVATVVRRGFKYRDRILRPEEVIVKKYSAVS
jgi:molecular chaperone GrpE